MRRRDPAPAASIPRTSAAPVGETSIGGGENVSSAHVHSEPFKLSQNWLLVGLSKVTWKCAQGHAPATSSIVVLRQTSSRGEEGAARAMASASAPEQDGEN